VTGVIQHRAPMSNVLLNLPHVVISAIMLYVAYYRRADIASSNAGAFAPVAD
jgi:hypothetical protein